ncbi:unnamed protein product [Arabis nemorensis]|uniref:RPN1 N-terminal domain-containing protein n=1 Tax=Arabis nemorensis TaxID=586526 RepID=A0A565BEW2_9BRAS|nr:unnamed protein product [Arabis nemorensis]
MDVEDLDLLLEHVDKANFKRTCNYLTSAAKPVILVFYCGCSMIVLVMLTKEQAREKFLGLCGSTL